MKLNPKVMNLIGGDDYLYIRGHMKGVPESWDDFSEDFLNEYVRDLSGRNRYEFLGIECSWARWVPERSVLTNALYVDQKYAYQRGAFPVTVIKRSWIKEVKS